MPEFISSLSWTIVYTCDYQFALGLLASSRACLSMKVQVESQRHDGLGWSWWYGLAAQNIRVKPADTLLPRYECFVQNNILSSRNWFPLSYKLLYPINITPRSDIWLEGMNRSVDFLLSDPLYDRALIVVGITCHDSHVAFFVSKFVWWNHISRVWHWEDS